MCLTGYFHCLDGQCSLLSCYALFGEFFFSLVKYKSYGRRIFGLCSTIASRSNVVFTGDILLSILRMRLFDLVARKNGRTIVLLNWRQRSKQRGNEEISVLFHSFIAQVVALGVKNLFQKP